jgi:hypothetical protein
MWVCKLAIKYAVPPKLITARLLSEDDKNDMLAGLVSLETVDFHVKIWKSSGMCNYADGSGTFYRDFKRYQGVNLGS